MTQDGPLDRLRRFGEQHGTKRAHVLHIKDGEVWYTETAPGALAITWFPHRSDHPDAPELATTSEVEGIDCGGGEDAVAERLRDYFAGRDQRTLVEVRIEREASPAEVEAVERVFDEAGVPAVVSPSIGRYSIDHTTWTLVIAAPLASFFTAFGATLGTKVATDVYEALSAFVARVYEERRKVGHANGWIELDEGPRRISFDESMPMEAYRVLADLDVEGTYHSDHQRGAWRKL